MNATGLIMVYDDACPLCVAYTKLFVKAGILPPAGRQPFSNIFNTEYGKYIDPVRGKNEIPLVDKKTGTTIYGVEALLKVLGSRWAFFNYLQKNRPLFWLIQKAYFVISYNRKVIVPPRFCDSDKCSPQFNLKYRLVYFITAMLITGVLFFMFGQKLGDTGNPSFTGYRGLDIIALFLPCVVSQFLLTRMLYGKLFWNYAGNVATFNLIGAFSLLVWLPFLKNAGPNIEIVFTGIFISAIIKGYLNIKRSRVIGISNYYAIIWSILFLVSFLLGWFLFII